MPDNRQTIERLMDYLNASISTIDQEMELLRGRRIGLQEALSAARTMREEERKKGGDLS